MATRRPELSAILHDILGSDNVYFQPPASLRMSYPCIRYELSGYRDRRAGNELYSDIPQYKLILIDRDPDSKFVSEILKLRMCSFSRFYTAENLNHWIFYIYY